MKEKYADLTLGGSTFRQLQADFDKVMQRMIDAMQEKKTDDAKITITINAEICDMLIPEYGPGGDQIDEREARKVVFKHKIVSQLTTKDEESGTIDNNMELAWDEVTKTYVLAPIRMQQMTVDDYL